MGYDLFLKVPRDFAEGTATGGACSVVALVVIVVMAVTEVATFAAGRGTFKSSIDVDVTAGSQLRINFNLSFPQVHCDFASVDLWDKIGRQAVNVTRNVEKWTLDRNGQRAVYRGRNRRAVDVETDAHSLPPLRELHRNGVHVEPVGRDWDHFVEENDMAFVLFHAPWCGHCRELMPTWERLAERLAERTRFSTEVAIASVDCVEFKTLCDREGIKAFPTMRFLRRGGGRDGGEDYHSDRTVGALLDFVDRKVEAEHVYRHYPHSRATAAERDDKDHPGCLVAGFLLVNRVPGNFHVTAHSRHHSLNTFTANVSHRVNHLSFGLPLSDWKLRRVERAAKGKARHLLHHPLDGRTFAHPDEHHAWHHYLHVVPSRFVLGTARRDTFASYQIVAASHLQKYELWEPPEARFAFDLSPMAVVLHRDDPRTYDFITGLLAVVGGAVAVAKFGNDLLTRTFLSSASS